MIEQISVFSAFFIDIVFLLIVDTAVFNDLLIFSDSFMCGLFCLRVALCSLSYSM